MKSIINRKQLIAIVALYTCIDSYSQNINILNAIQASVPFLNIVTNARIGAFGEIGTVSSSFYKESGLVQNPALLAKNSRVAGGSVSYMPWLSNLISDLYRIEGNLYFSLNKKNTLGYSYNYAHFGRIHAVNYEPLNAYEYFHQLSYSHTFDKHLSAGTGLKYIRSDIVHGILQSGFKYQPANAFAIDLGTHYETGFTLSENLLLHFNTGATLNNLGTKVKYTSDPNDHGNFLPASLKLGIMVNPEWYVSDNITLYFDLAYQIEKLLVPTPPVVSEDSTGKTIVLYGEKMPSSLTLSWIQSFYDAPGGFKEEMHEIIHKIGTEVRLNYADKMYAAVRSGRFMEHATKGNRKYNIIGIGVGVFGFTLDSKFVMAPHYSPMHNNYALTLGFCANLDGQVFRF